MYDICGVKLSFGDKVFLVKDDYIRTKDIRSILKKEASVNDYFGIIIGENQIFICSNTQCEVLKYHIIKYDTVIKVNECNDSLNVYFDSLFNEYNRIMLNKLKVRLNTGDIFLAEDKEKYVYLGNLLIDVRLSKGKYFMDKDEFCVPLKYFKEFYRIKSFYLNTFDLKPYYKYYLIESGTQGIININYNSILPVKVYYNLHLVNVFFNDQIIENNKHGTFTISVIKDESVEG